MKKILISLAACVIIVAILKTLTFFVFEQKEIIYSLISTFLFIVGILFLKTMSGIKFNKFLKIYPIKFEDTGIIVWMSIALITGGFILNIATIAVCDILDITIVSTSTLSNVDTKSFILSVITMTVIPAVMEELFFRGALMTFLEDKGKIFSLVITSLFFALVHGSLNFFVTTFFAGIILSLICLTTNSIYTSMIAHFLNNIMSYFIFLYSEKLSEVGFDNVIVYIFILIFLISIYNALNSFGNKMKKRLGEKSGNEKIVGDIKSIWAEKGKAKQEK